MILHIMRADYIADHRVHLWFNDGTDGEIDLSKSLDGPIFIPLKDVEYFRKFHLEGHTLAWLNGADFAPEYLQELMQVSSSA